MNEPKSRFKIQQNRHQYKLKLRLFLTILFSVAGITSLFGQATNIRDFEYSESPIPYTVPAGINELVIECWGAGGGGSAAIGLLNEGGPGAGGGGGAHAHRVVKVTPGQTLTLIVGKGGAGGTNPYSLNSGEGKPGGKTIVRTADGEELVVADGGYGASFRRLNQGGSKGGSGGRFNASKGDVIHPGGNGSDAGLNYSGAGGGTGGRTHGGYNAVGTTAGGPGSCYCGIPGPGGQGRNTTGHGYPGPNDENPGRGVIRSGGGGGGGLDLAWGVANGGNGANGYIRIKEQQSIGEITGPSYTEVGNSIRLIPPFSGGEWRSSRVDVASVDSTGLVTGLSVGETIIIYSRGNFLSTQSTEFPVYVYPQGQSISITGLRSYCPDGSTNIILEASTAMQGDLMWDWTGPNGFKAVTAGIALPAIEANAGTYTVRVTKFADGSAGANLVENGNFEDISCAIIEWGNYLGYKCFSSDYVYDQNSQPPGTYNVRNSIINGSPFQGWCPDFWNVNGNFFMLRGNGTANTVWRQTVPNIKPNTNYQISYFMQAMQGYEVNTQIDIEVQVLINGQPVGPVFKRETSKTCTGWHGFAYNWNSGSSTSADIRIKLNKPMSSDYQIGLDDISLKEISSGEFSVMTASVDVYVGTNLVPTIDIISTPQVPLVNRNNTFVAHVENAGIAPTFKWYVNDTIQASGINPVFKVSGLKKDDKIYCELIPDRVGCGISGSFFSDTLTVQDDKNYWLGYASTHWNAIDNWSKLKVPGPDEDIEFATIENYGLEAQKDLEVDRPNVSAMNYINKTDKKLIIMPDASLTIKGVIDTDGENKIIVKASDDAPNGSLIITNPAAAPLATVEMWSKAWIDQNAASNNKMKWQYFGIPVTELIAAPTFKDAYIRKYNEALATSGPGSQWEALTGTSTMIPFAGYEITQPNPKKYSIDGVLVKNGFEKVLCVTHDSYYRGQHIFANPYTAAINIETMSFGDALDATVYLYNSGSYAEWTDGILNSDHSGSYTAIPQHQAEAMGMNIPSMQGFLIRVLDGTASDEDRTLRFDYSSLTYNTMQLRSTPSKAYLKIDLESNRYADQAWLFKEPHCTSEFDNGWDGHKLLSSTTEAYVYIATDNNNFQVSSTNELNDTYLGFQAGEKDVNYTLRLNTHNLSLHYHSLYLIDEETGISTDLLQTDSVAYEFTAIPGTKTTDRFKISTSPVTKKPGVVLNSINAYLKDGYIYINNTNMEGGHFEIYNLQGRRVTNVYEFAGNTISSYPLSLISGIYIVRIMCGDKLKVVKIVYP